jgi:hypothetical protein
MFFHSQQTPTHEPFLNLCQFHVLAKPFIEDNKKNNLLPQSKNRIHTRMFSHYPFHIVGHSEFKNED